MGIAIIWGGAGVLEFNSGSAREFTEQGITLEGGRVGKKVEKAGNAERLLALHDELDGLDKKESYFALSLVLLVLAAALIVVGMARGSVYLEGNGFLLLCGSVIFGGKELSKGRRMKALGRKIAEIEESGRGGPDEMALHGIEEKMILDGTD